NPVSGNSPRHSCTIPTCSRMACQPENFTQAGFFFGRVVLHTTARANVRGRVEANRVRFSHATAQPVLYEELARTGNKAHGGLAHRNGHQEDESYRQARGGHNTGCYSWPSMGDEPYTLHVLALEKG